MASMISKASFVIRSAQMVSPKLWEWSYEPIIKTACFSFASKFGNNADNRGASRSLLKGPPPSKINLHDVTYSRSCILSKCCIFYFRSIRKIHHFIEKLKIFMNYIQTLIRKPPQKVVFKKRNHDSR